MRAWKTLAVRPETQYAPCGGLYVAYQVLGEGPFDLVVASGSLSNIEYGWEDPTGRPSSRALRRSHA